VREHWPNHCDCSRCRWMAWDQSPAAAHARAQARTPHDKEQETTSASGRHGCRSVGAAAVTQRQGAGGGSAGSEQRAPSPAASGSRRAQGGGEAQAPTGNSPDSPPTPPPPG
jgi:hypothetical protein